MTFSMNANYFATLIIIVLAKGLEQSSVSAQVLEDRNMPLLTIFSNVFVQSSRLHPSQSTDLSAPPDTGTPDDRKTPGGTRSAN